MQRVYTLHCLFVFTVLAIITLLINFIVPGARRRRWVAGIFSRGFLHAACIPFTVRGTERLPAVPCVAVANHASYIDGIVAIAALPADFAFVIKKEMLQVPLAALLLRQLGSEFVERFNRHEGASDARRVFRAAATGQSLVFFPEGTFDERPAIRRFLAGAFTTARRSNMPVVAVAIHGTRRVFPPGRMILRRAPICVEILEVLDSPDARQRSRELISRAVGEPLVPDGL